MGDTSFKPPHAFWVWFETHEAEIRQSLSDAIARDDRRAMQEVADLVSTAMERVSPGLTVRIGGPEPFALEISAADPKLQRVAEAVVAQAPKLAHWEWTLQDDPVQSTLVQDDEGRELEVSWEGLAFLILPSPKGKGRSVLFSIPEAFNPQGEDRHLYEAAATEILNTTLGGVPPGLTSYELVPASTLEGQPTRPIAEFQAAWQKAETGRRFPWLF